MKCYSETISGTCGVAVFSGFNLDEDYWETKLEINETDEEQFGGAGWILAGFINTEDCKIAYEELMQKYTLVYQSPVRLNENSDNKFFFCIFDGYKEEQLLEASWSF